MPDRLMTFASAKSVFLSWLAAGLSTFGIVENSSHDTLYAAAWAGISAVMAAVIAGSVKICVTTIQTSRSRREQHEIERSNDFKRLHEMYQERIREKDLRLQEETTINRAVRSSKHSLISDVGARDLYIDTLEELLRAQQIPFERQRFRNLGDAFREEDRSLTEIINRIGIQYEKPIRDATADTVGTNTL